MYNLALSIFYCINVVRWGDDEGSIERNPLWRLVVPLPLYLSIQVKSAVLYTRLLDRARAEWWLRPSLSLHPLTQSIGPFFFIRRRRRIREWVEVFFFFLHLTAMPMSSSWVGTRNKLLPASAYTVWIQKEKSREAKKENRGFRCRWAQVVRGTGGAQQVHR